MHGVTTPSLAWIEKAADELASSIRLFAQQGTAPEHDQTATALCTASLAARAERIYRLRRRRDVLFGQANLFGEPAYDILLDIFVAEARGCAVSVSSACIAAAVPPTTALRHISKLVKKGLLARIPDSADRRRAYVELTPRAREALSKYLELAR